jgi:hypothetical protein
MTEVLNLLDLPTDILQKIKDYVEETPCFKFKSNVFLEDYYIDIDLDIWSDELINLEIDNNEDDIYDFKHTQIDEYVSYNPLDVIETIVKEYGFTKAIKLYNDTYGSIVYDEDAPDNFVRQLAYVIISEFIETEKTVNKKLDNFFS